MKRKLVIYLIQLLSVHLFAQKEIDSVAHAAFLMKNDTNKVMQYVKLGTTLKQKDIQMAICYADTGRRIASNIGYKRGLGRSFIVIGDILRLSGDLDSAFQVELAAVKIMQEINDPEGLSFAYNNIGNISFAQNRAKEGLKWFLKSLHIKEQLGDKYKIATSCINIALMYSEIQNSDSARYYLQKSISIGRELKNDLILSASLINYAAELQRSENYNEAIKVVSEAIPLKEKIDDTEGFIIGNLILGGCLRKTEREKEALQIFQKISPMAQSGHFLNTLKDIYINISGAYEDIKQFDSALFYHVKYTEIKDSVLNENNQEQINLLNKKFQLEQKDKVISIRNAEAKEQETKRKYLLLTVSLLILLVGVAVIALIKNQRSKNVIMQQKQLVEQKQKEVIDSIRYAQRIQKSLMPTEKYIEKKLKQ